MAQAVRKAFAADADSYDRARRKLVPCFDDFYRTALELLPVCGELLILGKLVIRHTQALSTANWRRREHRRYRCSGRRLRRPPRHRRGAFRFRGFVAVQRRPRRGTDSAAMAGTKILKPAMN